MDARQPSQRRRDRFAARTTILVSLLAAGPLWLVAPGAPSSLAQLEVTPELLGNPFKTRYPDSGGATYIYSRNPRDLHALAGRIYFAYGSSLDNTGPVDIPYYDPLTGFQFDTGAGGAQFIADEEQLLRFRVIDGVLVTPGRDPLGSPAFGNFYRQELAGWVKYPTINLAAHVQDIYKFQNRLFVGAQTSMGATSIQVSDNNGVDSAGWQNITLVGGFGSSPTVRVSGLFELAGTLYSSTIFAPFGHAVWRYDGVVMGANQFTDMGFPTGNGMFPSTTIPPGLMRIERWITYAGNMVYLGVTPDSQGHEWEPVGLYKATGLATAQRITLPGGAVACDLLVGDDGKLYVLGNTTVSPTQYLVTVHSTTDLMNWTELLRFTRTDSTFARSFERLGGDFYFGLGGSRTVPPLATGDVLRVPQSVLGTPTPTVTSTLTATPTIPATSTATGTPPPTHSPTAAPTATPTATSTVTSTATPTATTPTIPATSTATGTPSPTQPSAPTATRTPTLSVTGTLTAMPAASATSTATRTPSPTHTRTSTPTATRTPTATPVPQVNVGVAVAPGAAGQLQVTLRARNVGCAVTNSLQSVQLIGLATGNARVLWPGAVQPILADTALAVPGGVSPFQFTVERVSPSQATTVRMVVTDGCGPWPTFVGGGPVAF